MAPRTTPARLGASIAVPCLKKCADKLGQLVSKDCMSAAYVQLLCAQVFGMPSVATTCVSFPVATVAAAATAVVVLGQEMQGAACGLYLHTAASTRPKSIEP
eukprot:scaffold110454_cov22-Tisochrysis_lutea.AAC.1